MRNCIPLAVMFLATINGATLCAADTTVYTWGYSGWGQLGDGSLGGGIGVDSFIRVPTAIARTATTVVAGADNCYAITATGSLYAWGKNLAGQVGNGTNTPQASPVLIGNATDTWSSLACKSIRPIGIRQVGGAGSYKPYWWGMVITVDKTVGVVSVTVNKGGSGYAINDIVTLSGGGGAGATAKVGAVDDPDVNGPLFGRITAIKVTNSGSHYTSAPTVSFPAATQDNPRTGAEGTAILGLVSGTEFADDIEEPVSSPVLVPIASAVADWEKYSVASGTSHYMLLAISGTDAGKLKSFGYNAYGQLGMGDRVSSFTPVPAAPSWTRTTTSYRDVPPPTAGGVWKQVSCGLHFTVGISTLGHMYTWGMNDDRGQLGHGAFNTNMGTAAADPVTLSPKQIMPGIVWTSVACGYDHTLALTASGELFAWGSNSCGELGIGSNENTPGPTKVGDGWTSIAAGDRVSFGFKGSQAYSWGNNKLGQLGIGTTENANSPRLLTFSGTMISAGGSHAVGR